MQLKCLSCKSANHFIAQCPLINYIPNKDSILYRFNVSEPQLRAKYEKRRLNRSDCRGNYRLIQIKAFEFKGNHLEELSKRSSSYEHSENELESKNSQTLENIEEHSNETSPQLKMAMERSQMKSSKDSKENHHNNKEFKEKSHKNLSNPASPMIPSETKFKNLRIQIEKIDKNKIKTQEEPPKFPEKSIEYIGEKNSNPRIPMINAFGEKSPNSKVFGERTPNSKFQVLNAFGERTPNSKLQMLNAFGGNANSGNLKRRESKLIEIKSSGLRKDMHKGDSKGESSKSINLSDETFFKIMDFEHAKDYKFYYPHNNHLRVIKHLQRTKSKKKNPKKSISSSRNFFSGLLAKSPFLSSAKRRERERENNRKISIKIDGNSNNEAFTSKMEIQSALSNDKILNIAYP